MSNQQRRKRAEEGGGEGGGRYTLSLLAPCCCLLLLYWRGGGAAGQEENEELLERTRELLERREELLERRGRSCRRGFAAEEGADLLGRSHWREGGGGVCGLGAVSLSLSPLLPVGARNLSVSRQNSVSRRKQLLCLPGKLRRPIWTKAPTWTP